MNPIHVDISRRHQEGFLTGRLLRHCNPLFFPVKGGTAAAALPLRGRTEKTSLQKKGKGGGQAGCKRRVEGKSEKTTTTAKPATKCQPLFFQERLRRYRVLAQASTHACLRLKEKPEFRTSKPERPMTILSLAFPIRERPDDTRPRD